MSKNLAKLRRHLGKSVPADLVIKPIRGGDDSECEDEGVEEDWKEDMHHDMGGWQKGSAEDGQRMEISTVPQTWKKTGTVTWNVKPSMPASPPIFALIGPDGEPLRNHPSHELSSSSSTSASESSTSLVTTSSSSSSCAANDSSMPCKAAAPEIWLQRKPLGRLVSKSPPPVEHSDTAPPHGDGDREDKVTSRLWLKEVRGDRTVENNYEDIMRVLRSLH